MSLALETHALNVVYGGIPALWEFTVQIPAGHLVGIIGPNGAGKSTLVKVIAGIIKPLSGHVTVYQKHIAYVPQRSKIDWDFPMTAFELVQMGLWGKKMSKEEQKKQVEAMLDLLKMTKYSHVQIGELSGGQQQRLLIARALIQGADLFLLDEVFNGIDLVTEEFLLELFKKMTKEGKTIVIVHHDLTTVKRDFDFVVMMNVLPVAVGAVSEVFTEELIAKTYGKSVSFLEEAYRLCNSSQGSHVNDRIL